MRPAGSTPFLIAVLCLGGGFVTLGLGLAPKTTEALPVAIVLLVVGTVLWVPSWKLIRAAFTPDTDEAKPGQLGLAAGGRPPSAVSCPNCGGPGPLRLAEPTHSTCAHCGHRFPLAPELARQLTSAAEFLKTQTEAERHITKGIEALALKERGFTDRLTLIARVMGGVAVVSGLYGMLTRSSNDLWFCWVGFSVAAIAWTFFVTRLGQRLVPTAIRTIVGRWTALQLPGIAGLMCRVCGGPLPSETAAPVLRCAYCAADNLAGQDVLTQLMASASHAARGKLAFDQRARKGDELAAFALLLVPALAAIGWFALGAFAGSGFIRAGDLHLWADPTARFVVVRAQRHGFVQTCIALPVSEGGKQRLVFDFEHLPLVTDDQVLKAQVFDPVKPSWLIGKNIEGKGEVRSVYRTLRYPTRHFALAASESPHYLPSDFNVLGGELTCLSNVSPDDGAAIDMNAR